MYKLLSSNTKTPDGAKTPAQFTTNNKYQYSSRKNQDFYRSRNNNVDFFRTLARPPQLKTLNNETSAEVTKEKNEMPNIKVSITQKENRFTSESSKKAPIISSTSEYQGSGLLRVS